MRLVCLLQNLRDTHDPCLIHRLECSLSQGERLQTVNSGCWRGGFILNSIHR